MAAPAPIVMYVHGSGYFTITACLLWALEKRDGANSEITEVLASLPDDPTKTKTSFNGTAVFVK